MFGALRIFLLPSDTFHRFAEKHFDLLKPLAIGVTGSLPLVGCWLAAELIARGPALVSSFDQSACLHFFPWCIVNLILKEDDHRKVCLIFKIVVFIYT